MTSLTMTRIFSQFLTSVKVDEVRLRASDRVLANMHIAIRNLVGEKGTFWNLCTASSLSRSKCACRPWTMLYSRLNCLINLPTPLVDRSLKYLITCRKKSVSGQLVSELVVRKVECRPVSEFFYRLTILEKFSDRSKCYLADRGCVCIVKLDVYTVSHALDQIFEQLIRCTLQEFVITLRRRKYCLILISQSGKL